MRSKFGTSEDFKILAPLKLREGFIYKVNKCLFFCDNFLSMFTLLWSIYKKRTNKKMFEKIVPCHYFCSIFFFWTGPLRPPLRARCYRIFKPILGDLNFKLFAVGIVFCFLLWVNTNVRLWWENEINWISFKKFGTEFPQKNFENIMKIFNQRIFHIFSSVSVTVMGDARQIFSAINTHNK